MFAERLADHLRLCKKLASPEQKTRRKDESEAFLLRSRKDTHQRVVYSLDQEQVNLCFTLLCFFCILSAFNLAIAGGVKCGFALNALSVWTH